MNNPETITVIGGGLAGCEVAWQLAERGIPVQLCEQKPHRRTEAQTSDLLGELVCSTSFRSANPHNAIGLLKEEMAQLGSMILAAGEKARVPAGDAFAVDREVFAAEVTRRIKEHPQIDLVDGEVTTLPEEGEVIVCTGPLTSEALALQIRALTGADSLAFYDAIAPIVDADSLDRSVVYALSRYGKGDGDDYLNCPMDREQYAAFYQALVDGDRVPLQDFEKDVRYFPGCLPVEVMAERGVDTLRYGPMKPVGLTDPRTGRRPYAVVQLRQEDKAGVLFNLVGCQTKLRISAQRELFRSLPGMGEAVFARFGSVHRNTYINAPRCLEPTLEVKERPGLFFAGQIAGVEGYVESAALGFVAGVNAARRAAGLAPQLPPPETAHGALLHHLQHADARHFQPMNVNFGLFPPLPEKAGRRKKRERQEAFSARALEALVTYESAVGVAP